MVAAVCLLVLAMTPADTVDDLIAQAGRASYGAQSSDGFAADLAAATMPLPADPKLTALAAELVDAEKPVADDPALVRLRSDVATSAKQLVDRRLTAIQDLAWALVNSPAFFFNH